MSSYTTIFSRYIVCTCPDHGYRLRVTQPVLYNTDVMRSQVPEGINIRSDPAEIQPLAIYIADISKFLRIDQLLYIPHGAIKDKGVPDHSDTAHISRKRTNLIHLCYTPCNRLFNQYVLPRCKRPHCQIKVGRYRSC